MTDIARLGLVVDASGAQREIRLTREELVKLANGGKLAQQSLATVVQPITQTTTAAAGATRGLEKLRGPLTQIAITASGMPGPLGRVASVLSNFALGGTVTVGVLAGVGAMSYAWEELTKHQREQQLENERTITSFRKMERELGEAAKNIRIATLEAQEAALAERVDQGVRGFGVGETFWERWSGVGATRAYEVAKQQLQDVRNRLAELRLELNKFARDGGGVRVLPTITVSASAPRAYPDSRLFDPRFGPLPDVNMTGRDRVSGANMLDLQDAIISSVVKGLRSPDISASIAKSAEQAKYLTKRDQASAHVATWGVDAVASQMGPFGGALSGFLSGAMSGNMWLAAASGVTGLVDGVISLGNASSEAAKQARQASIALHQNYADFEDQLRVELGLMSKADAAEAAIRRETARRIEQLQQMHLQGPEYERRLRELLNNQEELIEKRRREADEMERINTAYRNAPRGFSVAGYSVATQTKAARPPSPPSMNFSGDITVMLPAGSSADQVKAFVAQLDLLASSMGAAGGSRSQALELM